jgi:hypothetical protein
MNDPRPTPGDPDPRPDPQDPEALDAGELDAELDADDGALQGSLRALLAPPTDIEDRVAGQVSQQLIARSVAGTALDLLGLGARTLMTILTDAPPPADRESGNAATDGGNSDEPLDEGRGPT